MYVDQIFPDQEIYDQTAMHPVPSCPGATYTVVPGDTLFQIAQRFGVTLEALLAVNPQIVNPDLIFPGQVICLPPMTQPSPPCPTGLTYMVTPGETLFDIAQRLGVSVEELLFLNPQITDPNQLQPGELLCIPMPMPQPCPPSMPMPQPCPPPPPMPCPPCPPWEGHFHPVPERPEFSPVPCPPREKERYPSVATGTPLPEPYYPGAFVYASPQVPWEECPYRPRRRRRLCRRRRRLF
ncbi:LysM peptidoglycan-binding domain-containing protein [Capillibacterium thermochitinicola]|uniref:LysM peptidoglycan-binding domain-containing protein n=1 Tax=Capillibacterium thermochitinicola TaxID=2699427 RepID=A0A8J6HW72_9FIRM|nr:LysM peptidoglycan-binding domain-containing protein [Capillibacterium thermochitinicola]MBA2132357.1 LysM peptidoglycan-binding domain-containing protein [Capillibacterium thermochitinicola]